MENLKQFKGRLVKVTRQVSNPITGERMFTSDKKPYMEDVQCEELYWGPESDGNNTLTIVYLKRIDDGTVISANPGEIVYLDIIEK